MRAACGSASVTPAPASRPTSCHGCSSPSSRPRRRAWGRGLACTSRTRSSARHGGRIEVESEPGRTQFIVSLPPTLPRSIAADETGPGLSLTGLRPCRRASGDRTRRVASSRPARMAARRAAASRSATRPAACPSSTAPTGWRVSTTLVSAAGRRGSEMLISSQPTHLRREGQRQQVAVRRPGRDEVELAQRQADQQRDQRGRQGGVEQRPGRLAQVGVAVAQDQQEARRTRGRSPARSPRPAAGSRRRRRTPMTPEMSVTPASTSGIASAVRSGEAARAGAARRASATKTTCVLPSTVARPGADQPDGVVLQLQVDGEEDPRQPRPAHLRGGARAIAAALRPRQQQQERQGVGAAEDGGGGRRDVGQLTRMPQKAMVSAPSTAVSTGARQASSGGRDGRAGRGRRTVRGHRPRPSGRTPGRARTLACAAARPDTALVAHSRRHGHVPVHRHRGLDAAAAQRLGDRWPAVLRAAPRAARATAFDGARRRRGRHGGRRVLRRLPDGAATPMAAAVDAQRALAAEPWPDDDGRPRPDGPPHRRGGPVAATTTSASTCTARPASPASATAARCCSPTRRARWSQTSLPDGVSLRDLGEHRLKDLDAPGAALPAGHRRACRPTSRRCAPWTPCPTTCRPS